MLSTVFRNRKKSGLFSQTHYSLFKQFVSSGETTTRACLITGFLESLRDRKQRNFNVFLIGFCTKNVEPCLYYHVGTASLP